MKYQKPVIEAVASADVAIRATGQHVKPMGRYPDSPLPNFTINAYEADE